MLSEKWMTNVIVQEVVKAGAFSIQGAQRAAHAIAEKMREEDEKDVVWEDSGQVQKTIGGCDMDTGRTSLRMFGDVDIEDYEEIVVQVRKKGAE